MLPFVRMLEYGNIIPAPAGIKKINTYGLGHMFLTTTGDVYVYGNNNNGRFGTGSTANVTGKPVKVQSGVSMMYCGAYITILLMQDGTIRACGSLYVFNLPATTTYIDITSYFSAIGSIKKISIQRRDAGSIAIYALNYQGILYAIGDGSRGQFGRGSTTSSLGTFIQINTNCSDVICTAYDTVVVLKNDATAWFSGGYAFVVGTTDVRTFTNIGDTGITNIYGTGQNGELVYLTNVGMYVRGLSGDRYGQTFNSTNKGINLSIVLPFTYNSSTFNFFSDEESATPSAWVNNGTVFYGTGSSTATLNRMGYDPVNTSGTGFGLQKMDLAQVKFLSVVSGSQYSALIGDDGLAYGTGGFSGTGSITGEQLVNFPGNNPTLFQYTLLDVPLK